MPVSWTPDNERKFMLKIIHLVSSKDIDAKEIATCFPGATPRAIREHLYVLRKEAKGLFSVTATETGIEDERKAGIKDERVKGRVQVEKKESVEGGKGKEKEKVKQGRKRKAGGDVEGERVMGLVVGVGVGVGGGDVRKKRARGELAREEEKQDGEIA